MTVRATRDRLTIGIVHYRNYADLANCLSSIATHHPDLSVVVVDHASLPEARNTIARQFPSVTLMAMEQNPGFAAGVNACLRAAATPFVLLINPDCVLKQPFADALLHYAEQHDDVAIVGPRVRNADGSIQASARRFPDITTALAGRRSWLTAIAPGNRLSRHNLSPSDEPFATRNVDWVSGACMLLRRRAIEQIGGFDEHYFLYWEDADVCRRLRNIGWWTVYCPEVSLTHIGARSSRFNARVAVIAFHRSALRYYWRHAGVLGRVFSPVVALVLTARLGAALAYQLLRALLPASAHTSAVPSGARAK